jgi:uncharacterized protein YrrD
MQRRPDEPYPEQNLSGQPPYDPANQAPIQPGTSDYIGPGYGGQPGTMPPASADQSAPREPTLAYDRSAAAAASQQMHAYAHEHDNNPLHREHHERAGLDTSDWLKLSDLINRPIVDLTNGAKLGQVEDIVLGDDHSRVVGFVTQGKILQGHAAYPVQGATIGQDAITLPASSLQGFDEQRMKGMPLARPLIGMRLLSTTGNILGHMKDVRFDPQSWTVAYEVEGAGNLLERMFHPGGNVLPASANQSYGQDAIIVSEAAAQKYLGGDR